MESEKPKILFPRETHWNTKAKVGDMILVDGPTEIRIEKISENPDTNERVVSLVCGMPRSTKIIKIYPK